MRAWLRRWLTVAGLSASEARTLVGALAQATAQNIFAHGEHRSFSGPFARGDVSTIRLHLKVLAKHPILTDIYGSLARHAVEALPVLRRKELRSLLQAAGHETLSIS